MPTATTAASDTPAVDVGCYILARSNQYDGQEYPARVKKVNSDGTYDVEYLQDLYEEKRVRLVGYLGGADMGAIRDPNESVCCDLCNKWRFLPLFVEWPDNDGFTCKDVTWVRDGMPEDPCTKAEAPALAVDVPMADLENDPSTKAEGGVQREQPEEQH